MMEFLFWRGILILGAFLLDILLGDPIGKIHPVRLIGAIISAFEKRLYPSEDNPRKKRRRGLFLVIGTLLITAILCGGLLVLFYRISFWTGFVFELLLSWSALSAHNLRKESMKVYAALRDAENDGG